MKKSRKIYLLVLPLLVLLALACLCYNMLQSSKNSLEVSNYTIPANGFSETVRVVQLSDLHNSVFETEEHNLLRMVEQQQPDLIFLTGDLLNADDPSTTVATDTIRELSAIAPVYVSLGNHEVEYRQNFGTDLVPLYEDAGATVLEREYLDIEVKGQAIRLGGIYGYCLPEKYLKTGEADEEECAFVSDFQDTDRYTILLCHMPVCWLINDGLDEWNVDCVFSGHVHGGQVIFPLIGGLYGPDFGWFPGRLEGVYRSGDEQKSLVLSRGLGSTERVPRFNNIPEIVTVDFVPN